MYLVIPCNNSCVTNDNVFLKKDQCDEIKENFLQEYNQLSIPGNINDLSIGPTSSLTSYKL